MTKKRYIAGGVLLLLTAGGVFVAISASIHFRNQNFTVDQESFDASSVAEIVTSAETDVTSVDLEGRVTSLTGQAIAGAMVSAGNTSGTYRLTVFTNETGLYRLRGEFPQEIEVRVRYPLSQDAFQTIKLGEERTAKLDFSLSEIREPGVFAETVSASGHAALLDWPDKEVGAAFVSQCHFCHQIGNELTRNPRDPEDWRDVVDRMEGYLVLLTEEHLDTIAETLGITFTGDQRPALQTYDFSPLLAQASIEEWAVGDGLSFIHDADVGADGRLFGVDEGQDVIWILDRKTRQVERVPLPRSGLPVGGLFSGLAMPIGIFTGQHGPHSLAQGADGRFWITNALSSTLMSFDPKTKQFGIYPIGVDALYPHTIRIDGAGIVWFTIAASNQVGRFDPRTQTFTIIDLPSNGISRWITDAFLPVILKIAAWFPRENIHIPLSHYKLTGEGRDVLNMPYGIDVNPLDGSIWYSKLYANRIGRIDPQTLSITEIETPLGGPRRPRFDQEGILWIPSFDESALMKFNPKTGEFEIYQLPLLSPNEYETPYALNIHPKTGDVWITSNLSDRVFRFDPASESFVSYPSPTRVTFLRDLVFTSDGAICSSQSNLPAYAIEGGAPSFICINPEGAL